ncbi:anhydro-N-acetylmuramic acid kinase [Galbibacter sp.]|jgi:anhydro-N-acetylmuramic acid kinase|uniref:anhydro-N-acetylmuramic acid kinase n=1 Tax=Galbibacter sp. TaxID=2918471 RepID=UPI003A8E241D
MLIFADMEKQSYKVIGVMSGTSLDGIDLIYVHFSKDNTWQFEVQNAQTIEYPDSWQKRLSQSMNLSQSALEELNKEYTAYLAEVILAFIADNEISDVDFVASHGHTVFHQPEAGYTLQIGNLPQIARYLNLKVVCDFRVDDVALGGQGAPLVPIGDALLFAQYDYCLNLGGFANVSFVERSTRIAFDICAVNTVMNHLVIPLGIAYDKGGQIASGGSVHQGLLNELQALPFYQKPYPKSLGMEWVKSEVFPIIEYYDLKVEDVLRTYVEHIALQLSAIFKPNTTVLASGGGAYNSFLMERTRELSSANIHIPDPEIVDFKEALIFGLLGVLKLENQVNCLSSITGASKDHSAGRVYQF